MTLRQYVEQLKKLVRQYGDCEVVYAIDPEGNAFHSVYYTPSLGYYKDGEWYAADNFEIDKDYLPFEEDPIINAVCIN